MKLSTRLLLCAVCAATTTLGTGVQAAPLDEDFGYVDVRPGAHMFWVTYHVDQPGDYTDYPLIMWLQGGPGSSGVGYGNFQELGPYYVDQTTRPSAWTKKANVMFVDNPVGTGYSYVDNISLLTRNNSQIAADLVTMTKAVFKQNPDYSKMPFFIYCESYGGKMTVDYALALDQAIKKGEIDCDFKGISLGDSWISPMDSVNTWGPYLYAMGMVNDQQEARVAGSAAETQAAVDAGNWVEATALWSQTEGVVEALTDGVNFYNVLATSDIYLSSPSDLNKYKTDLSAMRPEIQALYKRHVRAPLVGDSLTDLMNGPQKERWNIPESVIWSESSGAVFDSLSEDFMKPVISSVERLLNETDLFVGIQSGDLDLICDTPGTYRWVQNMNYKGKADWTSAPRLSFHVSEYPSAAGYVQHKGNFAVFTILRSGHMIPIDAPSSSLVVIDLINEYANTLQDLQQQKEAALEGNRPQLARKVTVPEVEETKQSEDSARIRKLKSPLAMAWQAAQVMKSGNQRPRANPLDRERRVDRITAKLQSRKPQNLNF